MRELGASRCELCPVPPGLACPDQGWHCRAVARGGAAVAAQLRDVAEHGRVIHRPAASPPPVDIMVAWEADTCSMGAGPCGCGDGPPRLCGHPDRPTEVRRPYCLTCVSRQWWEGVPDLS